MYLLIITEVPGWIFCLKTCTIFDMFSYCLSVLSASYLLNVPLVIQQFPPHIRHLLARSSSNTNHHVRHSNMVFINKNNVDLVLEDVGSHETEVRKQAAIDFCSTTRDKTHTNTRMVLFTLLYNCKRLCATHFLYALEGWFTQIAERIKDKNHTTNQIAFSLLPLLIPNHADSLVQHLMLKCMHSFCTTVRNYI